MTQIATQTRSSHAAYGSRRTRAFTLVELIVVLVIVSVTAVIAIPRLSGASTRYRVDSAVQQVLADINVTAAEANRTSSTMSIVVDADTESFTMVGQPSERDPAVDQVTDLSREPFNVNLLGVSFGGDSQLDISGHGLMLESGQMTLTAGREGRRIVFTQGLSSVQIVNLNLAEPTEDEDIDVESSDPPIKVDILGISLSIGGLL